jgi:hypothetical protein
MSTKYYHAENCNRRIANGGQEFRFEPYALFGGTWRGVFATADAGQQSALDRLASDKRSAIREIKEADYLKFHGSLPEHLKGYNPPPDQGERKTPVIEAAITPTPSGQPAIVDREPEQVVEEPVPTGEPVEEKEVLAVGEVTEPVKPAGKPKKAKKTDAAAVE